MKCPADYAQTSLGIRQSMGRAGVTMPPKVLRRQAARWLSGRGAFAQAAGGGVLAAGGGAVEELCAEHRLQQVLGKHRRDDRVLGAVPRQRLEFAMEVV